MLFFEKDVEPKIEKKVKINPAPANINSEATKYNSFTYSFNNYTEDYLKDLSE